MGGSSTEKLKKYPPFSLAVLWFMNGLERKPRKKKKRYGIKNNKYPLRVKDLIAFEEDMIDLVQQIRFWK